MAKKLPRKMMFSSPPNTTKPRIDTGLYMKNVTNRQPAHAFVRRNSRLYKSTKRLSIGLAMYVDVPKGLRYVRVASEWQLQYREQRNGLFYSG